MSQIETQRGDARIEHDGRRISLFDGGSDWRPAPGAAVGYDDTTSRITGHLGREPVLDASGTPILPTGTLHLGVGYQGWTGSVSVTATAQPAAPVDPSEDNAEQTADPTTAEPASGTETPPATDAPVDTGNASSGADSAA